MRVGLLAVDKLDQFPNLPLMKLSTYHKTLGDEVEIYDQLKTYDKVYVSKIFTSTRDYLYSINANEIVKGGTGYNLNNNLPSDIEHLYPDYSLYGIEDTAYGFLTRGCPRNCPFCIVSKKEGLISYKVANLSEFWRGQKNIEILDPNILTCKDRLELLQQCAESKATINFNQGLDCRFLNDDVIELLNKIKMKTIHFAFDRLIFEERVLNGLKLYAKKGRVNKNQILVYILTNFETTHEQDLIRVKQVQELGFIPYITIYEKWNAPKITKDLARWCNRVWLQKSVSFDEYLKGNNGNKENGQISLEI